jgi:protocatechuate 3,4-dioxygenase beta subunit
MNAKFLWVIWVMAALLTGCVQAGNPTALPVTGTIEQPPVTPTLSSLLLATDTPLPTPTEAPATVAILPTPTGASVESPVAELPAPTEIFCSGALTSPNQEGPYYSAGSPERASLIETGMPGTPIRIIGGVFDQNCNPIPRAKVDFWQADANGVYDNAGYTLSGYIFTDVNGYYEIETIAPGLYTGRPPHIHVKVFAPDGRELLTTQMYFPGSEGSQDVLVAPDLLVTYQGLDEKGRQQVNFNFVVQY